MALSDSPLGRNHKRTKRRAGKAPLVARYSDQQKIELMQLYLITGDLPQSCRQMKIPEVTGRLWRQKDWWKTLEAQMRSDADLVLSAKVKNITEKSLGVVVDRLENGDFKLNVKTGEIVRVPVQMKDAHRVAVDMVKVSTEIDGRDNKQAKMDDDVSSKLDSLAQRFAELANKVQAKPVVEVTDVIEIQVKENNHSVPN